MIEEKAIEAAGPVRGRLRVPGSKSHTNRSLAIALLAGGESVLEGALFSDDTVSMMSALRELGADVIGDKASSRIEVRVGKLKRSARLDARDAGTVMRFLPAAMAALGGEFVFDGSARMRERPIGDLLDSLRQLGVEARSLGREGYPPIQVRSTGIAGGRVRVAAGTSSQYVSALLMASPLARAPVEIELEGAVVSRPFITMTEALMREFGAEVERTGDRAFRVHAPGRYRPGLHRVEGDATAATYFWAAAAVTGGEVRVENVGPESLQGDARFPEVLERMGCAVRRGDGWTEVAGTGRLAGGTFDLNDMPDTVPTLAVVAAFAEGPVEITNVANLRVKECDRIAAIAAELPKLGARVDERADALTVHPPEGGLAALGGASIATYRDHRMAMAFAVAGLAVPGVRIQNPACVDKTYPAFFEDLARLTRG